MSTSRTASQPPFRRDADGTPLCRWCGKRVEPPRRSWCSQKCVEEYQIRSNPGFARARVWERDRGICALCGADTEPWWRVADEMEADLRQRIKTSERPPVAPYEVRSPLYEAMRILYAKRIEMDDLLKVAGHGGHQWEMDHIVPVVEGGGECGLEGLRTLCLEHHKAATAALAARRAEARRPQLSLPIG